MARFKVSHEEEVSCLNCITLALDHGVFYLSLRSSHVGLMNHCGIILQTKTLVIKSKLIPIEMGSKYLLKGADTKVLHDTN